MSQQRTSYVIQYCYTYLYIYIIVSCCIIIINYITLFPDNSRRSHYHIDAVQVPVQKFRVRQTNPLDDDDLNSFTLFKHDFDKKEEQSSSSSSSIIYNEHHSNKQDTEESKLKNRHHHEIGQEAVIVCGIDGTVYTLDAWTGRLRGMFASGPPLVGSSSSSSSTAVNEDVAHDQDKYKDESGNQNDVYETQCESDDVDEDICDMKENKSNHYHHLSTTAEERVIPGLDGNIYSLTKQPKSTSNNHIHYQDDNQYQLNMLPISIQEVIKQPISTCKRKLDNKKKKHNHHQRHDFFGDDDEYYPRENNWEYEYDEEYDNNDYEQEQEECGLVMGQANTKIYALDHTTGKVQWMQNPKDGGFTTAESNVRTNSNKRNKKIKTVLLQREDYSIRHVDMDSGSELWNVKLGKFSALDFGTSTSSSSSTAENNRNAATAGPLGHGKTSMRWHSRVPLLPSRSEISWRNENWESRSTSSGVKGDPSSSSSTDNKSSFNPFPSIAFGDDGTSFQAIDVTSGIVLWQRKIESVVASVYGVGRESKWITLTVVDEIDVNHDVQGRTNAYALNEHVNHVLDMQYTSTTQEQQHDFGVLPPSSSPSSASSTQKIFTTVPLITSSPPSSNQMESLNGNFLHAPNEYGMTCSSSGLNYGERQRLPSPTMHIGDAKLGNHLSTIFVASTYNHYEDHYDEEHDVEEGIVRGNSLFLDTDHDEDSIDDSVETDLESFEEYYGEGNDGIEEIDYSDNEGITPWQSYDPIQKITTMRFDSVESLQKNVLSTIDMSLKTQNGLFLTWNIILLLMICVFVGMAFSMIVYRKKKEKWLTSPEAQPLSPSVKSRLPLQEGKNESLTYVMSTTPDVSLGECPALPILDLGKAHSLEAESYLSERQLKVDNITISTSARRSPVFRSASFPHINTLSKSSINDSDSQGFKLGGNVSFREKSLGAPGKSALATESTFQGTNNSSTQAQNQKEKNKTSETETVIQQNAVGSLDGIPLVRYSRYRSEFNELSRLGKGGFGTVFKCTNALDGREYAVKKVIIKSFFDSNGQLRKEYSAKLQRVLREVKILALLDHPNIVRYYTAWLEVENDARNLDHKSVKCEKQGNLTHGYSSDLLAGMNDFTTSGLGSTIIPESVSPDRGSSYFQPESPTYQKQRLERLGKDNPLNWNTTPLFSDDEFSDPKPTRSVVKQQSSSSLGSLDGTGFTWDRSGSCVSPKATAKSRKSPIKKESLHTIDQSRRDFCSSFSSSRNSSSSSASSSSSSSTLSSASSLPPSEMENRSKHETDDEKWESSHTDIKSQKSKLEIMKRHILYIQMQLSKKTLLDYFETRKETLSVDGIDIPFSLRMFGHIARGVMHVHEKGLIHRDLKPSNCFMDDSEVIKIGDFGLSRETGSQQDEIEDLDVQGRMSSDLPSCDDNTAGVGTSSYASPEQMNGKDYGPSSDVYSLGIILFELCYTIHTGMERMQVFKGIKERIFPDDWHSTVKQQFPSVHELLMSMLSHNPNERPTAAEVASRIQSLLGEYTVLSLDKTSHVEGNIFVRVEAENNEGVLARTVNVISKHAKIVQYSLRGQENKAVMEFALEIQGLDILDSDKTMTQTKNRVDSMFKALQESDEIKNIRQISDEKVSTERTVNMRTLSM
mmetsp:Transcript_22623/g.26227  ORF Transcript_22623/g.26227 Transcript_22623/m.26227 type:complete len:1631 (-) Transcript_22623:17-4909(-)